MIMELPGLKLCKDEFNLMEDKMVPAGGPPYAAMETIVSKENAIEQAFMNLKKELTTAYKQHLAVIETKLKSVSAENERLHHERLLLAKEIQRRRSQEARLLEILGVQK